MKSEEKKKETVVRVRRYSDHPIVQKKVAEARRFLQKADLSFLDTPPKKLPK